MNLPCNRHEIFNIKYPRKIKTVPANNIKRMETVIESKINKVFNRMEDPRETLDYSYEKQLELLQNVKRGVAEVTSSKKRL